MIQYLENYPLSKLTTLQIGGPAEKFVKVKTQEELIEAIRFAHDQNLPFLVIGKGSNLLVADEGVDGLVIKNEITGIETIHPRGDRARLHPGGVAIKVNSGTKLQDLVDFSIKHGLSGLQKLTGIPGTVGGAVYGNAGAYGQTISDHIAEVAGIHSSSWREQFTLSEANVFGMTKKECCFVYRDSIFKKTKDIILEVTFQLKPSDPKALQQEAKEILSKRLVKYPVGIKCPGSFFKNLVADKIPPEILKNIPLEKIVYGKLPAGALLEAVGAKGQKLDGIEVAAYHANLFINTGAGTSRAFYSLAKEYSQKVKEKFNITLEPEVQLINLPPL